MFNVLGNFLTLSSFGESHGEAYGGTITNFPAGLEINLEAVQKDLDRRKPGQSAIVTQRKESDTVRFLSGIFDGKSTGTPIGFIVENENQRSKDYDHISGAYRPSHADYTYDQKYGIRDHRGGGRSSARETASRVVAGAIAKLALKQLGIPFVRAKVGDRYVLEKLQEKGWRIGAENSGHVILLDKTTTGDGIVAALQVVAAMARNHMSLHDLCSGMKMFPQILVNVRFTAGKGDPLENDNVKAVMADVEAALGIRGRVLLRKSGTEPLIRVMVEGEDEAQVTEFAHRIADAVKAA